MTKASPKNPTNPASRILGDAAIIVATGMLAVLIGGAVSAHLEIQTWLDPSVLAATGYVWPSAAALVVSVGVSRPMVAWLGRWPRAALASGLVVAFGLSTAALYFGASALGLDGFFGFALVGAALALAPVGREAVDRPALAGLLAAMIPGAMAACAVSAGIERRYALVAAMDVEFMNAEAKLLAVLALVPIIVGVAVAPMVAPAKLRARLGGRRRLAAMMAAALAAAYLALTWANRAVIVPRLNLAVHMALACFEWGLLAGAGSWLALAWRPRILAGQPQQASMPWASARLTRAGLGAAMMVTLAGIVVYLTTPDTRVARRSDYLAQSLSLPILALADADADGYLPRGLGGIDCANDAADIHPLAAEVADDGIDQNCSGGDLSTDGPVDQAGVDQPAVDQPAVDQPATPDAALVIVFTIDTLRPDFMGVYGADRPTTPYLTAHRDEWTRFDHAYTSGGITTLALPSLLRGRLPMAIDFTPAYRTVDYHYRFDESAGDATVNRVFASPRDDDHPTIAGVFGQAGLPARAFVDDGPARIFQKGFGFEADFAEFSYPNQPEGPGPTNWGTDLLIDEVVDLVERRPRGFIWIHDYDPHDAEPPCEHFESTPGMGCYRDAIHQADQAIGRLAEALLAHDQWASTAIFVTADHGEALGEHRLRHHGLDSFEEFVHIPLLAKWPGQHAEPRSVSRPVSLLDVSTTAVSAAGLAVPPSFQGDDLRALMAGADRRWPVISQMLLTTTAGRAYRQQTLLVDGTSRYMRDRITGKRWLYDIGDDPGQRRPVYITGAPAGPGRRLADQLDRRLGRALETLERRPAATSPASFP